MIIIPAALICILFLGVAAFSPSTGTAASKAVNNENSLPDSIRNIAEKSCLYCHGEPGNPMALMHLDLSNWAKYSPEKQASKAKDICKMVTKDKMPPKSFAKSHPGDVPTEKEMNMLCNWAQSLQSPKK